MRKEELPQEEEEEMAHEEPQHEEEKTEIVLPVYVKGINKQTGFNVMDCPSAYNAILGCPWIHDMKAVPSTFHQTMKFPSPWGIQEIKSERKIACECYKVMMKPQKQNIQQLQSQDIPESVDEYRCNIPRPRGPERGTSLTGLNIRQLNQSY